MDDLGVPPFQETSIFPSSPPFYGTHSSSEDCDSPQIVGFSGDTCLEGSGGAKTWEW